MFHIPGVYTWVATKIIAPFHFLKSELYYSVNLTQDSAKFIAFDYNCMFYEYVLY